MIPLSSSFDSTVEDRLLVAAAVVLESGFHPAALIFAPLTEAESPLSRALSEDAFEDAEIFVCPGLLAMRSSIVDEGAVCVSAIAGVTGSEDDSTDEVEASSNGVSC